MHSKWEKNTPRKHFFSHYFVLKQRWEINYKISTAPINVLPGWETKSQPSKIILFFKIVEISYYKLSCYHLVAKSCPTLFATQWIVAHQAPFYMGFPRQEYGSGLPFPSPGDLYDPEIEPTPPALASWFFTTEPPGKLLFKITEINFY